MLELQSRVAKRQDKLFRGKNGGDAIIQLLRDRRVPPVNVDGHSQTNRQQQRTDDDGGQDHPPQQREFHSLAVSCTGFERDIRTGQIIGESQRFENGREPRNWPDMDSLEPSGPTRVRQLHRARRASALHLSSLNHQGLSPARQLTMSQERWASRLGLVLAMAGNAIGLGNFLRFPRLAAQYGGGAFMIPYLIALLLLGIPLMWLEWSMGRMGGRYGHGTTVGMFGRLCNRPAARLLGTLGVSLPLLFVVFYTYIESWTLAYSWYSAVDAHGTSASSPGELAPPVRGVNAPLLRAMLAGHDEDHDQRLSQSEWTGPGGAFAELDRNGDQIVDAAEMQPVLNPLANAHTYRFLREYQGAAPPGERTYFHSLLPAAGFWLLSVGINVWIISRGISGGVERLARVAMPLLFVFAVALAIRVLTLGAPDPARPENSVWAGLNYIWEPNFAALADFGVWLAAAGQIFFTLSIGTGTIQCYASYLRPDDDCALTGLTTAATNEFAEVVLGATIAIPVSVAVFGLANTQAIASQGSFDLGFVAMPLIFEQMPLGRLFATLWFALLFFAGVTSSVGLCQPMMAFLQEEIRLTRRCAAGVCGALIMALGLPILLWFGHGYMDQYDFWVGTFGLAVFALLEVIAFAWIYGSDGMWRELTHGAQISIPRLVRPVIKYVVPGYLMVLLAGWTYQSWGEAIRLENVPIEDQPYLWRARWSIILVIAGVAGLAAWATRVYPPASDRSVS